MKRKLTTSLEQTVKRTKDQSERSQQLGSQSERSQQHTSQSERSRQLGSQSERSLQLGSQSDAWETDSGFSSGRSSPVSGRSSPVMGGAQIQPLCETLVQTRSRVVSLDCETQTRSRVVSLDCETQTRSRVVSLDCETQTRSRVVSLDCEMVGTGPGRTSELARCSLVDYGGVVLLDLYVRPIGPVTDYRSQWSGIRKHHLTQATPFSQARDQVRTLLEGKVLVGHSVQTDLKSLDLVHPGHMIRDTSCSRLLTRLAGFPREPRPSLKALTNQLLRRKIQVGRGGHSSVEDAVAALDLYKLVEGEWEREAELSLRDERDPAPPSYAQSQHFLSDQYWPAHS